MRVGAVGPTSTVETAARQNNGPAGLNPYDVGIGGKVQKAVVYNDGDNDVVVTFDCSPVGTANSWTSRTTVTCKARGQVIMNSTARGADKYTRYTVTSANGPTNGQIEVYDESSMFVR